SGVNDVKLSLSTSSVEFKPGPTIPYFGDSQGAILSDIQVGRGRVLCLMDPFIVENKGITEGDNVLLALNLVKARPAGRVLFDEFHHGYGSSGFLSTGILGYFKGTPIQAMLGQTMLLLILVIFTAGRRFARPVPLKKERRTTSLEFVSSMATLTRLARASE